MRPALVAVGTALSVVALGAFAQGTGARSSKSPDPATHSKVRRCPSFVVYRGKSSVSGTLVYRASNVRRSRQVSCSRARKLLKSTYGTGPLHPIKEQYVGSSGRPIYWLRGGWRCSNGAGGAACRNVRRRGLNVVDIGYGAPRQAIVADVR